MPDSGITYEVFSPKHAAVAFQNREALHKADDTCIRVFLSAQLSRCCLVPVHLPPEDIMQGDLLPCTSHRNSEDVPPAIQLEK